MPKVLVAMMVLALAVVVPVALVSTASAATASIEMDPPDGVVCAGSGVTLTENGGEAETWLWSTGETTQSIKVWHSGEFCVTITDASGAEATACATVSVICCEPTPPPTPTPPPGDEGFTPGFWRNHYADWTLPYTPGDIFDVVFGVSNNHIVTLREAIWLGGGHERALIRHGTAALLNAAHPNVEYPLTVDEVIAKVQYAYASGDFNGVKNELESYNKLGGSL